MPMNVGIGQNGWIGKILSLNAYFHNCLVVGLACALHLIFSEHTEVALAAQTRGPEEVEPPEGHTRLPRVDLDRLAAVRPNHIYHIHGEELVMNEGMVSRSCMSAGVYPQIY